uniref:Uncharacterized protein n=1 Tax=Tetraselmis sp. GSL018 TaxID=582737 RepID=A0A061R626_9CHLO
MTTSSSKELGGSIAVLLDRRASGLPAIVLFEPFTPRQDAQEGALAAQGCSSVLTLRAAWARAAR